MTGEADLLIDRYIYDIEQILRAHIETRKHDLHSEDPSTRQRASEEIEGILYWLPNPPQLTDEERVQRIKGITDDSSLADSDKLSQIAAEMSTGRKRGRPRNADSGKHAIQALSFFYSKGRRPGRLDGPSTWRDIAQEVRGCEHKGRTRKRSCKACGESMCDLAGRLETLLRSLGYFPWMSTPQR
jgi:hypothetical protein